MLSASDIDGKRQQFAKKYDYLRTMLLSEPRGHDGMFGAIPITPTSSDADLGLFFMNIDGYDVDMCIHGTIGTVTALVETGTLPRKETLVVETPAGIVEARVSLDDGQVVDVTIRNVSSYVAGQYTVPLETERGEMSITTAVVYVGNFYALVDASQLDISIHPNNVPQFVPHGLQIMDRLNERQTFTNESTGQKKSVTGVQFYGKNGDVDNNLMVGPGGKIDRSPCGTGTCAKMTLLFERGELDVGQQYQYEGILGTRFTGQIIEKPKEGETTVTVPEVTGPAHIVGSHSFLLDPDDPILGFSNLKDSFNAFEISQREP
jgi:proline racemase